MKVKRVGHRGTEVHESDVEPQNWAGDSYRKYEAESLGRVGKNMTVHLGRGVRTARLKDIPAPKPRPSTEGMTRITNRGTGSRKSTNKGTS
ncbi:MAG TPA: hypothetical protein VFM64_04815 [Candidatus Nitrosotenuis sp.]|nr:hypothetical protein [Candidatus Nitrosotenuis sp.]